MSKRFVAGYNCQFHLAKGGYLTIIGMPEFTAMSYMRTMKLVKMHSQRKKLKRPTKHKISIIPTLTDIA